jgi:hypothetical protein
MAVEAMLAALQCACNAGVEDESPGGQCGDADDHDAAWEEAAVQAAGGPVAAAATPATTASSARRVVVAELAQRLQAAMRHCLPAWFVAAARHGNHSAMGCHAQLLEVLVVIAVVVLLFCLFVCAVCTAAGGYMREFQGLQAAVPQHA